MKKLVTAACALAAGLAMAQVESANVVGYETITLKPGWNMFSINFAKVGDNTGMLLDEIFPGKTNGVPREGFTFAATQAGADYVKVWDAESQGYTENYYLYVRGSNANNYKWMAGASTVASKKIKSGSGFWFFLRGQKEVVIQVAGEVEYGAVGPSIEIKPGWNMIGAPYAGALDFNRLGTAYWKSLVDQGLAVAAATQAGADYIKLWNAATQGYDINYYLYVRGSNANNYKWMAGASTVAPDNMVDMGKGVWYYHRGDKSFTLQFAYPYNLSE